MRAQLQCVGFIQKNEEVPMFSKLLVIAAFIIVIDMFTSYIIQNYYQLIRYFVSVNKATKFLIISFIIIGCFIAYVAIFDVLIPILTVKEATNG